MKFVTDYEEILSLLYEFDEIFPHNRKKVSDYSAWAKKIQKYGNVLILCENNKNIGISVYYDNDIVTNVGYISLIGIKNNHQGKGLGHVLLQETLKVMKLNGMKSCLLEVDIDNCKAFNFYKKHNFNVVETKDTTSLLKTTFD